MDRGALGYWETVAERWRIAPPLSPSAEDIRYYERKAQGCADSQGNSFPLNALLLGVTPGIVSMRWPEGTSLVAVDWSGGMFRSAWPRQGAPVGAAAVIGDWRELPFAPARFDFAAGDGCYTALGSFQDGARLNAELHRSLRPGGLLSIRCFCRPETPLRIERLFEELAAGQVRNLDLLRWLTAMAVHGNSRGGVALQSVWKVWNERFPDLSALKAQFGWTEDAFANLERWSKLNMRYSFATLGELRGLAAPHFELLEHEIPDYEWGECFPRLLMRARS